MYILVNEDIKITKGKLAGQVGHAIAVMFYNGWKTKSEPFPIVTEYMENIQKKIVLNCSQSILEKLEYQGYITIRDKGFTELPPNTLTCVNLGILDKNNIPKELNFIKELKLCK